MRIYARHTGRPWYVEPVKASPSSQAMTARLGLARDAEAPVTPAAIARTVNIAD